MLLHPDGSEELLVPGGVGAVTDPFLSFDAQWAYYAYFYDVRPEAMNAQHGLPYAGADVFRLNLATRQIQQPTFGEFAPNTGAGHFDESNPVNPGSSFGRLGYGILNLAPAPIAGGKIAFTSNRNGFAPLLDEIPRHSRWARIPGGDVVRLAERAGADQERPQLQRGLTARRRSVRRRARRRRARRPTVAAQRRELRRARRRRHEPEPRRGHAPRERQPRRAERKSHGSAATRAIGSASLRASRPS